MRNLQNDARIALIETRKKQERDQFDKCSMYPEEVKLLEAMSKSIHNTPHSPLNDAFWPGV